MAWEDRAYNREHEGGGRGLHFIFPMPSVLTFGLIISCVAIFFIERLSGDFGLQIHGQGMLTFRDALAFKQPWRLLTYQYLHESGGHLFWNILSIYFFVPPLERLWGWKRTYLFYTVGGIVAGVTFGIMTLFVPAAGLAGASGCIFAVLGALTAIMPDMQVLAMLVIPITMRTLTLLYAILFLFTVFGDRDLSDAAHLGGLAFGFFAVRYFAGALNLTSRGAGAPRSEWESDDEPSESVRRPSRWASRRALKLARAEREERERIDQILAKVSAQGMHSLNWMEKRSLKKATERQRQRDSELARIRRS